MVTTPDLVQEMFTRSAMLDEAIEELMDRTRAWAEAERRYARTRSEEYLMAEGTIPEREAIVMKKTEKLRYEAHLAEGLKVAALESVRSRRAQLSAAQSIANAVKAEADLAKTGPTT